ncbi:uncharacterized protein LOC132857346 [Tachysurus vachellii]|uniref:uncharacterized protein LOC132857346 n=1 Tax=Tachysurus vachellii TaxID=175792 RepID=UPI00296B410A|nr:uncharacterized protein LOC132857346 [Tachysurus vachellii]
MSLLYISILWVCACVDSAESLVTLSAPVGSTVILPCKLTEDFKLTSVIKWQFNSDIVFERSSNGTYSGSGYEGRVDVPEDELRKGNCSLVLKNVRFTDDKIFTMVHTDSAVVKQTISVTLSVYEDSVNERRSLSEDSDSHQTEGRNRIILYVVIVIFIIIVIIIICVSVYYSSVKGLRRATDSTEQDGNRHHHSVQYDTTSDSVTYTTVATQPQS